ncbi:MAG: type II toxin-antitoxin system RelE/ParE family toxin [Pseudolabrys sp.]
MRLYFSPRATRDLSSIFLYLDARSKGGARNVMRAIHDSIRFIAAHPHGSRVTDMQGAHTKTVRAYPFRIFYRILEDKNEIEILHIRHASRPPWQGD